MIWNCFQSKSHIQKGRDPLAFPLLFLHCLAEKLSARWEKSYGEILGWIKARLSFAVIRATDLCLRGSRVRWRSGTGIDDGAGLPTVMPVLH